MKLTSGSFQSLLFSAGTLFFPLAGCAGGETSRDAGGAPPADAAPADAAPVDAAPSPDVLPLYTCPSAMPVASRDAGFVPTRRPTGVVPVLAAPVAPGPLPDTEVVFSVDTSQGMWPISQDVYGMNTPFPKTGADPTVRATSERLGGNRWSAYNWENNASNAGNDYKFQSDGYLSASNAAGDAVRFGMDDAWARGAGSVLTVPIGDYVAADKSPGGDVRGDGGTSYLATRFRKNVAAKSAPFSDPPNPTDDSVYQDEFVAWAKGCAGDVPLAFCLDNEPDLWKSTHAEIHPDAVTYDELCQRTVTFASAIKAVWPAAPILGFVSYGWNGYTTLQNAPDAAGKGEFVDYFLAQMKAAEDGAGRRLVDYLDLHWYPEAKGSGVRIVFDATPTDATKLLAVQEARLQAPRSLWDSTYKETSWIVDNLKGTSINLIPRMRQKIAAQYPGTKLAFTEWNYGGGTDITGAIAAADVLGIFGREHVDMAHIWPMSAQEPFVAAGVKAFRNYDGQSGEFGDIGITASNTDTVNTSVYASLSSSNPNQVIVVAINKKSATITAGIRLAHPKTLTSSKVYVLAGSKADL
ncbi:MAG TPA: glycoside hydrolase family 44 protein, partial [Polyangia bacterium]